MDSVLFQRCTLLPPFTRSVPKISDTPWYTLTPSAPMFLQWNDVALNQGASSNQARVRNTSSIFMNLKQGPSFWWRLDLKQTYLDSRWHPSSTLVSSSDMSSCGTLVVARYGMWLSMATTQPLIPYPTCRCAARLRQTHDFLALS